MVVYIFTAADIVINLTRRKMKKILTIAVLAAFTLTGCATADSETLTPAPTQTQEDSVEAPSNESEPQEYIEGSYMVGIDDTAYNSADKAVVLDMLATACDFALAEGVVENYGDARAVLFSDEDGYKDYTAFLNQEGSSELLYSLDYFFSCFISIEYAMLMESGESNIEDYPMFAAKVTDNVYQIKYEPEPGAGYTTQYIFDPSGRLISVVSDPKDGSEFTLTLTYGTPSEEDSAILKELVDAL